MNGFLDIYYLTPLLPLERNVLKSDFNNNHIENSVCIHT